MRKFLFTMMAALFNVAFGAANDTLVSFSTTGPDTYMDGSIVLDGECYALVWTAKGRTFGGFKADGSLVNEADRLVVVAGLAKDGRCPTTLFEIDATEASRYAGGTFALYLLDTRVRNAAGVTVAGGAGRIAATAPGAVNAAGRAAAYDAEGSAEVQIRAVSLATVGAHTEIAEPVIRGVEVKGSTIRLDVKGLEPTADYWIMSGVSPTGLGGAVEGVERTGGTFTFKSNGTNRFFKIKGARRFQ